MDYKASNYQLRLRDKLLKIAKRTNSVNGKTMDNAATKLLVLHGQLSGIIITWLLKRVEITPKQFGKQLKH